MGLPMMMELAFERGFCKALNDFILMQVQLDLVLFTFSLGTKTHYYGRALLRAISADNYRRYSPNYLFMFVFFTTVIGLYVHGFCWVYIARILNSEEITIWTAVARIGGTVTSLPDLKGTINAVQYKSRTSQALTTYGPLTLYAMVALQIFVAFFVILRFLQS